MNQNKFLETIKVFDGKIYNLSFHQDRYESVLNSFGIDSYQTLATFIKAPSKGLYRCRLVYTADNIEDIEVTFYKYTKKKINSLKIVYDDSIEYCKKYLNRDTINELYEKRASCDDILIVKNSFITDTSIANIAFFKKGIWYTPKKPLLKGTTRQRLLDEKKIIEEDIKIEDLKNFSQIALFNAMIDFDIIRDISYEM